MVASGEEERAGVGTQRGGEVNSVVAAQTVGLREVSCRVRQLVVETQDAQLGAEGVDHVHSALQGVRVNPTLSMCSRRRRSRFGIDQLARHHGFGAIPQLRGKLRSRFVEHQLDQR